MSRSIREGIIPKSSFSSWNSILISIKTKLMGVKRRLKQAKSPRSWVKMVLKGLLFGLIQSIITIPYETKKPL
ncbi:MAG: hypothetical protein Pg6C_01940 [Treponemataceae bacterium]|nr:MAG: hypothetical protein Pg6C_01940 [Treponemataceae bacterium]